MRSMSKTQLVDNIVHAWDKISSDTIIKSFKVCGQVLNFNPDDILCMKKDRPCADSRQKLKDLLAYPTYQLDLHKIEVLPDGLVNDDENNNFGLIDEEYNGEDPFGDV